ncbi:MAG: TadE/TadG family type IV pilus assembly protein [Aestuariivirga sp.]
MSIWQKFLISASGNVGLMFGLSAPVLILAAGGSIDYLTFSTKRAAVQNEIDAAALGAAKTLVENASLSIAAKEKMVRKHVADSLRYAGVSTDVSWNASIDTVSNSVAVEADLVVPTVFLKLAGISDFQSPVRAVAVAETDEQPVCILSLDPSETTGIRFRGNGAMKAKDCVVWSNASGAQSITFDGNGKVSASKICAVGRASSASVFEVNPTPESNCNPVEDPLADWTPPASSACTHNSNDWIDQTTAQLDPGVYCGGLRVSAKNIFLSAGVYMVRDGPLILRGESKISGKGVGIFLEGAGAKLEIDGKSTVGLESATSGPMAGIVIASSAVEPIQNSTISGRADLKIGGVIYLPNHVLTYWGESDTRAASPVTTIIAKSIDIGGDAYLEVKNDKSKAKYAPVVSTSQSVVRLID